MHLVKLFCVYLFLLLVLVSCKNKLTSSYKLAKNNKQELQKVISQFSQNPKDSLKLQAAEFLIKQMQFNYALQKLQPANDSIKKRYELLHKVATNTITADSIIPWSVLHSLADTFRQESTMIDVPKVQREVLIDAQNIKAQDLISHIDNMFWVWENSIFCKDLSKQEFFESLLPYRLRNEPLDLGINYSSLYYDFFNKDSTVNSVKEANIKINNYLQYFQHTKVGDVPYKYRGLYSILEAWGTECIDRTIYATKLLRSGGIPTFIDATPQWNHRIANRRHFWCSIKNGDKGYQLFSPPYEIIDDSAGFAYIDNAPKIFRYRGIPNPKSLYFLKEKEEYVPGFFNDPFLFDVTEEQFEVTSINVPIKDYEKRSKHCYLAIFNAPEWSPIDFSELKGNIATFNKTRPNHIYSIVYYPDDGAQPIHLCEPFFVDKSGTVNFMQAKGKADLTLFQKYQQKEEIRKYVNMVVGAKVQVANQRDFSDAVTLHTITENPKPIVYSIPLKTDKNYRYVRIISNQKRKSLYITHIEFHTNSAIDNSATETGLFPYVLSEISKDSLITLQSSKKLKGEIYCSTQKWMSKPMLKQRQNGCDGNYNTYTFSGEISFDFGKPVKISSFRYAPRHADNWVVAGQRYALYYYNKGWVSADTIEAKYNFLEFKDVPSNTIYWLRNIDTGREEQAFVYKDGKQVFINTKDFRKQYSVSSNH